MKQDFNRILLQFHLYSAVSYLYARRLGFTVGCLILR